MFGFGDIKKPPLKRTLFKREKKETERKEHKETKNNTKKMKNSNIFIDRYVLATRQINVFFQHFDWRPVPLYKFFS